jgi:hypothetical protein
MKASKLVGAQLTPQWSQGGTQSRVFPTFKELPGKYFRQTIYISYQSFYTAGLQLQCGGPSKEH